VYQQLKPLPFAGKPTGEAYVEFSTSELASEAMAERQRAHLGSRYIEVRTATNILLLFLCVIPQLYFTAP
jgi:hypothetical protein